MTQASVQELMRMGLERHRAGQLAEARQLYSQILAQQPANPDALCLLGIIARQEGRLDEALGLIQRAIALAPEKPEAYQSLGDAQRARGHLAEAAAAYAKAVEQKPAWIEARGALGDSLRDMGQFEQAIAQYNEILRMKPGLPAAHLNIGRAFHAQQKLPEAIAAFRRTVELNANWAEAYESLGGALGDAGQLEEAAGVFQKALALKPGLLGANWGMGKILISQGREAESLGYYQRAAQLNPDNAHAHFLLACRFEKAHRMEDAAREFREAIRLKPNSPDWQFQLAAVSGDGSAKTAPAQYVRNLFDFYAPRFDKHLVEKLRYQTPQHLLKRLQEATGRRDMEVLDLGCGTGLCGVEFRPLARRMVGVDLSPAMVKIAQDRKIYDELIVGDLMPPLRNGVNSYDLVIAGDVLVYVGDLSEFMPAVAAALRSGGFFACSIEDYEGEGFFLHSEERFAHSIQYFRQLAEASGLREIAADKVVLRRNKDIDVYGWILVMGKK